MEDIFYRGEGGLGEPHVVKSILIARSGGEVELQAAGKVEFVPVAEGRWRTEESEKEF
jgi:hypothetical protein